MPNHSNATLSLMFSWPGTLPPARTLHSLTGSGNKLVLFGGQSLEDGTELNDLHVLEKVREAGALPLSALCFV